ncbi:signal recognition particle, SRP9/SRP14 subunit [Xylona heveae TC161]|uniref:Signal recognition particle subunit SRP14 n=1 Tax=Xylona heveae (strain CBS 132557 / TC161) TaxID=1328760 RepID=A0A165G8F6_XYLHT|nr:signal recognition particle, SRP9/SRP14 subunit [Xylona heveae TC161]KZF21865.1 signal recognition particle, SRP9/SRP14 subunit [Xylona heveae TC161]
MASGHLSNDDFFIRLAELFDARRQKDHGSVYLTQKRLSHPSIASSSSSSPAASASSDHQLLETPVPILIRASDGKSKSQRNEKTKLSTVVEPDSLDAFFTRYAEVCKGGMQALKKRDRSGRKKAKAKKRKADKTAA